MNLLEPGYSIGNPLQYPCLENIMDRGAWWAAVLGVAELGMTERLTLNIYIYIPTPSLLNFLPIQGTTVH